MSAKTIWATKLGEGDGGWGGVVTGAQGSP